MRNSIVSRLLMLLTLISAMATSFAVLWNRYTPRVAAQSVCVPPPSGLVSWWPGDGNANDIQGANQGTLQNGATFTTGKVGQAFSFNASLNSGVSVPSSPELNPTDAITVDAWIKPLSFPNAYPTVVRKDRDPGGNAQYILAVTNTSQAHCHIGNLPELFGGSVTLNQWSHLACTYDRQAIRLYVNGSEVASAPATQAIPTASTSLVIGKENGFTDRNFDGLIDEVEIFNRALAASEIQAIVHADSAGKCKPVLPPMVSVDPKAAYLHATCDNPALPTVVDLAAAGFAPGDGLKLSYSVASPGFGAYGCGGPFQGTEDTLVSGVFSNSSTLLPPSAHPRVPGAIEAGPDYVTGPTFFCSAPNDIPQDFRIFPPSGFTIQIPAGATHLFLGINDSYWEDNCGSIKVTLEHVVLNQTPVAKCQNVTVSVGANCTASASIDNGSSDPDGDTIIITQSPAGPYSLGTTNVTLTVTDSKGAASTCTATVTVVDSTPPQITPPANASYQCLGQVPPGQPSQATASDNCSTPTITVADAFNGGAGSPASPLIITRVFTAKDAAGNSNSATQTITVVDNTPPTVTAPPAVNVSTGAGATTCGATVSDAALGAVTANDNCGGVSVTRSGVPAGNLFPVGTTTITYTANDGHGNTASATQTVTVIDNTPPTLTACAAAQSAFANNNCQAAVPDFTSGVTASDNCGGVTITQSPAAGTLVGLGATTLTLTVKDAAGNSSACTTTFIVSDNTPPTITACVSPQSANANANCQAAVPDFTSGVAATDNCTASGSLTITQSPLAGTLVGLGTTPVTITVKDAANNTVTCSTSFTVLDNIPPVISCPAGTTASADVNCQAAVPNVLNGVTASDNCTPAGSLTKTQSPAAGTLVGLGTTTITVTVTDAAGNSRTCTTPFTVVDTTPPTITLQPAVTTTTGPGPTACGTVVMLPPPTGSDNCGSVTITCSGVPAGNFFPVGTTTITCTTTDGSGNTATATQTVTVTDNQKPTLNAPPAVNVSTGAGATACGVVVSDAALGSATASDNCGSVTITRSGVPANDFFPVGTTTITYTATDAAGNTTSATQTVTVIDNTAPVIACPASLTVAGNILGSCTANLNSSTATASDNCGTPTVTGTRSDGQALNAPYPQGTTTITWRATDAAGNQSTCPQTVTVTNPAPVATITGPATGSIYAVGMPVNFTGSFTDNAGGTHTATWTFDNLTSAGTVNEATGAITASHSFTAAGVYKVTLTVTDGCGGSHTTDMVGPDGLTELVVIYDASAGWVTGGGWINSPAGAYVPNPSLTGKANFGFVSKYQNGATVPDGNTEFQFKASNLNFSSTAYEWMVIAGAKAQYKGSGTINGAGDYRFMLTAIDGDQPGGGGQDKFRIRIWNNNGGGLVYDNQMNAPDDADPTTVLGGGSIVIHK